MTPNLSALHGSGYRLVYPCQGHSDVHLHGNTARRRRRVTARVSIRLPDKRLLDPDDLAMVRSVSLFLSLILSSDSLTRDVTVPRSTRRNKVLACTWRLWDATRTGRARHWEESRNMPSPASAPRTCRKLSRNTMHRAQFTSAVCVLHLY